MRAAKSFIFINECKNCIENANFYSDENQELFIVRYFNLCDACLITKKKHCLNIWRLLKLKIGSWIKLKAGIIIQVLNQVEL